jgi:hypothetical protein
MTLSGTLPSPEQKRSSASLLTTGTATSASFRQLANSF